MTDSPSLTLWVTDALVVLVAGIANVLSSYLLPI
jgi:hypothetical protein